MHQVIRVSLYTCTALNFFIVILCSVIFTEQYQLILMLFHGSKINKIEYTKLCFGFNIFLVHSRSLRRISRVNLERRIHVITKTSSANFIKKKSLFQKKCCIPIGELAMVHYSYRYVQVFAGAGSRRRLHGRVDCHCEFREQT